MTLVVLAVGVGLEVVTVGLAVVVIRCVVLVVLVVDDRVTTTVDVGTD